MAAASQSRMLDPLATGISGLAAKLLLLAPSKETANFLDRSLSRHGLPLEHVESPEAALEGLRTQGAPEVVLLDPGPAAEQLLSWVGCLMVRPSSLRPPPCILMVVSAEQIPSALTAVQMGAYDYLVRPFSEEQLVAAVRRSIEYRRLRVLNDLHRYHLEQLITARTKILQDTMHQLEQSYDVTLEALGNALDLKDAETEGHSKRVTAYTLALGRAMGLTEPQLRVVGRGAFLHDIGKMAIPDAILRKPGKLTEGERAIMRTHSELGYRMISKIPYLREAAEIVYAHQECFDGTGYPRALRGEEIHIGARIFALADTLDAITSNRPYRRASTIAEARKEVLRCAGTQFDPAIVDVFIATPDSIWQNLREGIMRDGPEFSPFGYTFGEVAVR